MREASVSVADEAAAMAAVYTASARGTAAAGRGAKKGYRKAQELGMAFQNWRHGGGEPPATTAVPDKPAGKNWTTGSTESTDESTTYYHHTRSTRKESR